MNWTQEQAIDILSNSDQFVEYFKHTWYYESAIRRTVQQFSHDMIIYGVIEMDDTKLELDVYECMEKLIKEKYYED